MRLETRGVDAWLECRRAAGTPGQCAQKSGQTPGGRIAAVSQATFGSARPASDKAPSVRAVSQLVAAIRSWNLLQVAGGVQRYLPRRVGGLVRIFVVANGHPMGDAYVRTMDLHRRPPRLTPRGEPVVLLNAVRIAATYGGTAEAQARSLLGVIRHETFHVAFARYRRIAAEWIRFGAPRTPKQRLLLILLNEGIAHFIQLRERLLRREFPRKRFVRALERLGAAFERLGKGSPATGLLRQANQGRFWDKYGAIAGAWLAYGVFRSAGLPGLRDAIRCGPARLIQRYLRARQRDPRLPPLPEMVGRLAPSFDLCR